MITENQKLCNFLDEVRFGVLATNNADGSPQLTVMWYERRGDQILMNTASGRVKDGNLRRDPRIALCIEDGYRYVTLYGHVALNDEQGQAQADIAALARRYADPERAERMIANFQREQRITLLMTVERVVENLG